MEIHKIIYETTREVFNVEDKLRIATVFLFCEQLGSSDFADFLYAENHENFIKNLNQEYKDFVVDFTVNFGNKNVSNAFYKTLEKVKETADSNGYLKALHEKDLFAIVISEIVEVNFDIFSFKKTVKKINQQLSLF